MCDLVLTVAAPYSAVCALTRVPSCDSKWGCQYGLARPPFCTACWHAQYLAQPASVTSSHLCIMLAKTNVLGCPDNQWYYLYGT